MEIINLEMAAQTISGRFTLYLHTIMYMSVLLFFKID